MNADTTQIRILIVDDKEEPGRNLETLLKRDLADLNPVIDRVDTFEKGEELLKQQGYDLAVLDVRLGDSVDPEDEDAGRKVYESVAEAQWLPVVFWTGVPRVVEELARPPLVQVVNKADIRDVPGLLRDALASGVPQFARHVAAELESVARKFLAELVSTHWDKMAPVEKQDVLPLLANRLSYYLRNRLLDDLHLRGLTGDAFDHPSSARYYLRPPVTDDLTTGDLYSHGDEWWVLATPQCDMEVRKNGDRKVDYLRLVRAVPIEDTDAGGKFIAGKPGEMGGVTRGVKDILGDHHRFYYLPAYLEIPHLSVDFEQIRSIAINELLPPETAALDDAVPQEPETSGSPVPWTRVATIDSPYVEALLYRLSRAVSRVGIEEIPEKAVLDHLAALQTAAAEAAAAAAKGKPASPPADTAGDKPGD